mmetsp:Transcript_75395/g.157144  ORF Transcript_75395/g.157144 Transcript_75395/m.157144 type:complete len:216 (-) Transcript_75395:126-773(-)
MVSDEHEKQSAGMYCVKSVLGIVPACMLAVKTAHPPFSAKCSAQESQSLVDAEQDWTIESPQTNRRQSDRLAALRIVSTLVQSLSLAASQPPSALNLAAQSSVHTTLPCSSLLAWEATIWRPVTSMQRVRNLSPQPIMVSQFVNSGFEEKMLVTFVSSSSASAWQASAIPAKTSAQVSQVTLFVKTRPCCRRTLSLPRHSEPAHSSCEIAVAKTQ